MDGKVWTAANSVERRLAKAWADDDADTFADVLLACDLYLPGFAEAGDDGQRLVVRERDEQTYVLVYTSVQALHEAMEHVTDGWRRVTFAELAGSWPNERWGLAISPHTPIGAYLGPEQVQELAGEVAAEPAFRPADERERAMRAAQQSGDAEVYLDLLVTSDVLLPVDAPARPGDLRRPGFPWLVRRAAGDATIAVFTSSRRLTEAGFQGATIRVPLLSVVRAWPGDGYRLTVNPGSAMESAFTGAQVPDLFRWAQELVRRRTPETVVSSGKDEPVAPPMIRVQAEITADRAKSLLEQGGARISGTVTAAGPSGIVDGYLVRWHVAAGTDPGLAEVTLPHGAQLVRLVSGHEVVVGTYDTELAWWRPSVLNVLRGD
ncbi:SseB family protein [Actinoplanes sp. L3-i22]|uniref:SseB family protein n=1 Tax=Actinoplanes sp. L3-i22 TaxID=2836373 RepID=UPI001C760AFC|nr:SseB family protein [Actinoplanes sp. L3-i22]BCY11093.1 hypothetical protein L3i22_061810 [Actinoplanes sp. L3-i22]